MFGIGMGEWLVIFLIVLLLFGAKRLPEIARALGKASNEFKKAKNELTNYDDTPAQPQYQQSQQTAPQQQSQIANNNQNSNPPQA